MARALGIWYASLIPSNGNSQRSSIQPPITHYNGPRSIGLVQWVFAPFRVADATGAGSGCDMASSRGVPDCAMR